MKRYYAAISLLLALMLPLGLSACNTPATKAPEAETTTEPVAPPPSTAPEANAPTQESELEVRRAPEEIVVYPFPEEALASALEAVNQYLEERSQEAGVLTFDVEKIAYDPMMTDVHVRQRLAGTPVDGWTEEDYYARQISFAVTYSATYDHEKTFMQDTAHDLIAVTLCREDPQSPWALQSSGVPVEEYSDRAMSFDELAAITNVPERILAGYKIGDDTYWLYLWDDSTSETRFFQYAP